MKVYRIYKIVEYVEWDHYYDDFISVHRDETIKFVDSIGKVNNFMSEIERKNQDASKCFHCPITNLTKRQYNNGKHELAISYCIEKDLVFEGNKIKCNKEKLGDWNEYYYEEIEVE